MIPAKKRHTSFKVTYKEIDEMIRTVDKNGDGKINYSEFRVMMGAHPRLIPESLLGKNGMPVASLPSSLNLITLAMAK